MSDTSAIEKMIKNWKANKKCTCNICGEEIGSNATSVTSHGRMHVRDGDAYEINPSHPEFKGTFEFLPTESWLNRNQK